MPRVGALDVFVCLLDQGGNVLLSEKSAATSHGSVFDIDGVAPFGFDYRRCPGEQLTIEVLPIVLHKVWRDKIAFRKLNLPNPRKVPVGPGA